MRIVVVSDSHSNKWNLLEAIEREASADYVYFLGDGYRDIESAYSKLSNKHSFVMVRGNCDLGSDLPDNDTRIINGIKVYATHGHNERVKFGTFNLEYMARENEYGLVLYGHTHQPTTNYIDGIHFFNPGSVKDGFYGVVDITDNGIICIRKSL